MLPAACDNGAVGAPVWAGTRTFRTLLGGCRDATDTLVLNPSVDNLVGPGSDGSDYIEGGGGADTIFGNQGQDDIIGGSSDLFTLTDWTQRPDAPNLVFGGSGGSDIARNDCGTAPLINGVTGACG